MINKRLIEIEKYNSENESRKFYKEVNWFRKVYQPKIYDCKSKTGEALDGEKEVMNLWTEYFSELLNTEHEKNVNEYEDQVICYPQPLIEKPDKDCHNGPEKL